MKPYLKAQTIRYTEKQDRRCKLTKEQRKEILRLYEEEGERIRPLSRKFGVSRWLIKLIVNPEAQAQNKSRIAANWRKYREKRGKAANARIMREFRARKYEMYMNGELTEKPTECDKDAPKENLT